MEENKKVDKTVDAKAPAKPAAKAPAKKAPAKAPAAKAPAAKPAAAKAPAAKPAAKAPAKPAAKAPAKPAAKAPATKAAAAKPATKKPIAKVAVPKKEEAKPVEEVKVEEVVAPQEEAPAPVAPEKVEPAPAPVVEEAPAPVVEEAPAVPEKAEEPAPVVEEEPKAEEPAPVVEEAVAEEVAAADDVKEEAPAVEEAPVEEAPAAPEKVETAPADEPVVDDKKGKKDKKKKKEPKIGKNGKKKLSGGKIAAIVIASILGVILIAVGVLAIVLFGGPKPKSMDVANTPVEVKMFDESDKSGKTLKYYVGAKDAVDLSKAFPGATFSGTCGISGTKISKAKNGTLTVKPKDGKSVEYKVYAVKDAYNAYGDKAEETMRSRLLKGENVVLHGELITTGKDSFQIAKGARLYGNGNDLHADTISAPRGKKKYGAHVFRLAEDKSSLNIQDLHVFVNTLPADTKTVDLAKFEYSGNGVDLDAKTQADGKYALSTLTNIVIENGQKLLHIAGADVHVKGCIFRNGADANIAAGTYKKKGANITIENSVSANSTVAGFLFYGWDPVTDKTPQYQQTLNIKGFFDIYNWKTTDAAKLVPATEGILADVVNGQVAKEINNPDFAPFMHDYKGKKYIHIGIIRLATGSCTGQNPIIQYEGKTGEGGKSGLQPTYAEVDFPLPGWVKKPPLDIVKRCDMISYDAKQTPTILPDAQLSDTIYKELVFGRTAKK